MRALGAIQLEAMLAGLALVTLLADVFFPVRNKRARGLGLAALVALVRMLTAAKLLSCGALAVAVPRPEPSKVKEPAVLVALAGMAKPMVKLLRLEALSWPARV